MKEVLLVALFSLASVIDLVSSEKPEVNTYHVVRITPDGLKDFINRPQVTLVLFYGAEISRMFSVEYEKAAKYLEAYNVKLGVYSCSLSESTASQCNEENVENSVYSFQGGNPLMTYELNTMFDVNSIVAGALELVLLKEINIVQSSVEKQDIEKSFSGKKDIVFGYFSALGTKEARVFLEIAYAFQDYYEFAITTEFKAISGLKGSDIVQSSSLSMWVLFCTETTHETVSLAGDCPNILYQGNTSLSALGDFMQELGEKTLFQCPEDDVSQLITQTVTPPIIYIYKDNKSASKAEPVINFLSLDIRGFAKLVIIDIDKEECRKHADEITSEILPLLTLKGKSGELHYPSSMDFTEETVLNFLVQHKKEVYGETIGNSNFLTQEVPSSSHLEATEQEKLIEEVETQDDEVAEAVFYTKYVKMKLDFVPALEKSTFSAALKTSPVKLVLFYLSFESVGMAFLRDFGIAAETLTAKFSEFGVLARVNCFDATDLCSAENITTYPVLRFYKRDDKDSQNYLGPLDSTAIINAVMLRKIEPALELQSEVQVEDFMSGEFPHNFSQFTPTSVLLLTTSSNSDAMRTFKEVSLTLDSIAPFAYIQGELTDKISEIYHVPVPSVIIRNRIDSNKPVRKLVTIDAYGLKDFVKQSMIPAVPELTVLNFPTLFSRHRPFAIMFLDKKDDTATEKALDTLTDVAMSGKIVDVNFCWMNAESKSIGEKILSEYTKTAVLPVMCLVDHSKAQVFNYQPEDMKAEGVLEWLNRVLNGKEPPSYTLYNKEWGPPARHYDFLAMLDTKTGHPNIVEPTEREHVTSDSYQSDFDEIDTNQENEMREELLALRRSRVYQQSAERREAKKNMVGIEDETKTTPSTGSGQSHRNSRTDL